MLWGAFAVRGLFDLMCSTQHKPGLQNICCSCSPRGCHAGGFFPSPVQSLDTNTSPFAVTSKESSSGLGSASMPSWACTDANSSLHHLPQSFCPAVSKGAPWHPASLLCTELLLEQHLQQAFSLSSMKLFSFLPPASIPVLLDAAWVEDMLIPCAVLQRGEQTLCA